MRSAIFVALLTGAAQWAGAAALPLPVQQALTHRNVPADSVSIFVENLQTGENIVSWHAAQHRTPASVMKLLTTFVALDVLGPTYRWKTELYFLGEMKGDVLHGDLLIKGYGDPYLVTERLWQLQRLLRQQGVRHITGDLLLDDSWFEAGNHDPAAFDREPLRAYNVAPNALMTNYKVVRYLFTPEETGNGVRIGMDPWLENINIENRLTVRQGACRGYQRGVAISPNDTYDSFIFSGQFPAGCNIYSMTRAALSHNAYTYGLFKSLWQETGGELDGGWKRAVAPVNVEPDMVFRSLSLAEIINKVNKHSNNVMARQLLYTLAAEVHGAPGTEQNGRKVVDAWLLERGLKFDEMKLDNGAGLSREASITAEQLAALLRYAWRHRHMPEFLSSLALSGLDGTLSRRLRRGGLAGAAHMKTGSLDHVESIAGYLQGASGDRYAVVMLHNYPDIHRGYGDEVQEALLDWLQKQ